MRRLAERAAELAAEVGSGQARGPGEVVDAQRPGITGVGEVLRAEEMTCRRREDHAASITAARRLTPDGG
jgi:hypothetical protein